MKKEKGKKGKGKKEEKIKKKGILSLVITLVVVIIIIGFAIFYIYNYVNKYKVKKYQYNGFDFVKNGNFWITQIVSNNTLYTIELRYGPRDLKEVNVTGNPIDWLKLKQKWKVNAAYVTFDPEQKNLTWVAIAASDISTNMAKVLNIIPVAACTKNATQACYNRSIVDCSKRNSLVIFINESNETKLVVDRNCIVVEGNNKNIVKTADRLILGWYCIMR